MTIDRPAATRAAPAIAVLSLVLAWVSACGSLVLSGGGLNRFVTEMGEDAAGELYVLTRTRLGPVGTTGEVLKLVPPGG